MRVIITGSRHTTEKQNAFIVRTVAHETEAARGRREEVTIIDGDCPYGGADTACRAWIHVTPFTRSERHPAQWHVHGRSAGPIRNQAMVDSGADLCLAFPAIDSRGTWDCVRRAQSAGIPTKIYPLEGE